VLPSHGEGFSLATVEALAMGVPVIVSESAALPGLVASGGGVISDVSSTSLADAIAHVLSDVDAAAEMSAAGRRFAAEICSPAVVAAATAEFCAETLRRLAAARTIERRSDAITQVER